ncbi:MAG: universal stress protein [Thermodesulfovibrionales bacterium]
MFEKVLTATDMLDACDAAVVGALEIAKQNNGKLFLLHVLEPSYFHECGPVETVRDFKTGAETAATKEYREKVKEELDKKCAGALKSYGNYQIDIAYGRPSIEIRRWARKFNADLIVLAPHAGRVEEGLIGTTIGNTVEDVIMHSTSPVIILNSLIPKERLNFKKVMVCVDFSKSCKHACEFAAKLSRKYSSKLFLFHMTSRKESEKEMEEKIQKFCAIPEGLEHQYGIWQGTEPYSEILKYAREKDTDLIVMGSHTKETGERPYIGSAVEKVSGQSVCPVIIVTHPDALSKIH